VTLLDSYCERSRLTDAPLVHDAENAPAVCDEGTAPTWDDDALLVERCLRGEVAAWEAFYRDCHDPLRASIRFFLGRSGADSQLVDELAARVWYALVDQDGKRLTKFNPRRGSVHTFLRLLARKETSRYFLAERRRLKKEMSSILKRNHSATAAQSESLPAMLAEFLASLTPRERAFCGEYLHVGADGDGARLETPYSSANIWQITRRIYKKFLSYIGSTP
jgi:hypothetical protein